MLKRMVLSDTYKPHTYEETAKLVPEGVAATLDPKREYGIRWWNRSSQKMRQVSEARKDGQRRYRRKVTYAPKDKVEWIAVPIPAFLPRDLVERARAAMVAPRPQERKNLARLWELRGVIRCPCGGAMTTHTASRPKADGKSYYHYYRCHRSVNYHRGRCKQKMERAENAEAAMWEFISGIMKNPEKITDRHRCSHRAEACTDARRP